MLHSADGGSSRRCHAAFVRFVRSEGVRWISKVRVSPTSADEPTLDLQKLPLGVDVADPEVGRQGEVPVQGFEVF